MTFPQRMRYGSGRQDEAVHLRLANYPPVITCFRSFLGAQGASKPPPRASRMAAPAEAAPRAGAPLRQLAAAAPGRGRQHGGGRCGWGRRWGGKHSQDDTNHKATRRQPCVYVTSTETRGMPQNTVNSILKKTPCNLAFLLR